MANIIEAAPFSKVLGTMIADDQETLLIYVENKQAIQGVLAFPLAESENIVNAGAMGIAAVNPDVMRGGTINAFDVTWWEVAVLQDQPGAIALTLTFGAGAKLSFRLPRPMPQAIFETLELIVQGGTPPMPEMPAN